MRKQRLKTGLAILLTAATCMTSFAANGKWIREKDTNLWMYQLENGEYAKSCVQKSGSQWFWIDETGHIKENSKGQKVEVADGVFFELASDNGTVASRGFDEQGNVHFLSEYISEGEEVSSLKNTWRSEKSIRAKSDDDKAWLYYNEKGELCHNEVKEIDGFKYYFDADGEIKWMQTQGVVDGYYINHTNDASIAVDRWISVNNDGRWSYFGKDGKMVTGVQTIDGVKYDFGDDGYVLNAQLDFPEIYSIELDLSEVPDVAEVGDTVEIPFTIEVKGNILSSETPSNASPSNASPSDATPYEADYNLFKNAYAVRHDYRVNVGDYNTKYVQGESKLQYAVKTKYEIDWDRQVIRIPIEYEGAVFGSMHIGKKGSNQFGIVCKYSEDQFTEENVDQIFDNENVEQAVNQLQAFKEELLKAFEEKISELLTNLKKLEERYKELKNISSSHKIDSNVKKNFGIGTFEIDGLALSAGEGENISFSVTKSSEKLPDKFQKGHNVAALNFTVKIGNKKVGEISVPVVVTISKPNTIKGSSFKLYHINNGTLEEVPFEYDAEKNEVKLIAHEFSTYFFAEETGNNNNNYDNDSDDDYSSGSYTAKKNTQSEGQWKQNATGWWYEFKDGSYVTNSWKQLSYNGIVQWYHFGNDGYMDTGWFKDVDGRWYYLNPVSDGTKGMMMTGWQFIDGAWYYFNEVSNGYKGAMLSNCKTPDGYQVGADGRWIQ